MNPNRTTSPQRAQSAANLHGSELQRAALGTWTAAAGVQAPNRPVAQPTTNRPTDERSQLLERNRLMARHMPLVQSIARRVHARLPSSLDLDDMVQEGAFGLMAALERYDARRGVPFSAFAHSRIKGAILDMLRGTDWVPRSVRRRAERLRDTTQLLTEELGRAPSQVELAAELGITVRRLERMVRNAELRQVVSLDALLESGDWALVERIPDADAGTLSEQAEVSAALAEGVAALPANEAYAVHRYYYEGLGLKAIAAEMGVSESRVSQLRRRGTSRMRERMEAE